MTGPTAPHGDYTCACNRDFRYFHAMAKSLPVRDVCVELHVFKKTGNPAFWSVRVEEGREIAEVQSEEAADAATRLLRISESWDGEDGLE